MAAYKKLILKFCGSIPSKKFQVSMAAATRGNDKIIKSILWKAKTPVPEPIF